MTKGALLVLALILANVTAFAGPKKLVVVVAKGSTLTNISKRDLKACFLGEHVSGGGKTLIPFNSEPRSPERIGFDKGVLGMTPDVVGRFWIDRKVRAQRGAPRTLPSHLHIAKVVAKFPGAISYLPADQLTPDVQPLKVDGVAYTDPAYTVQTE
ncbi:MAG TPA: hypothetical protein VK427_13340 [Kofleriaceae bacterium]|nr:hypothetical protein [Kofleriaceae bacterium]